MTEIFARIFQDGPGVFETDSPGVETARRGGVTLLVQGILTGGTPDTLLDGYHRLGALPLENLDGNFILALVDENKKSALIYRHLVGCYPLYYTATQNSFCFGSRLATVARRSGLSPRPNEAMLPALFLFRMVPGHNTLFEHISKLMPGEMIAWRDGKIERQQVLTMKMFDEPRKTDEAESVERIESVLEEILGDCRRRSPRSAILLSGGVDSMILQVHWNRLWRRTENNTKPPSAAVVLDHPHTRPDFEYTMSAVEQLQTEHLSVRQAPLTPEFMGEILSLTGEMPNHVQSFYFATLAAGMKEAGFTSGISGEGADGMFGNCGPDDILAALRWKRKLPIGPLRNLCANLADLLKPGNYTAPILRLANHVDDLEYTRHPQNAVAAFTDFETVQTIFGKTKMLAAMRYRRSILDAVGVSGEMLLRSQLIGFFGEGIETAAYWTAMFHLHGVDMVHPFQDSRLIRVASNIRSESRFVPGNPKQVLKNALARHVPKEFISRPKLSFGQPVFEWLSPGGELRKAVERIDDYPWLPRNVKQEILVRPNWVLWTLLCYDLWYKAFMKR